MPTQKMELFVESDSTEAMVNQAPAVVYTHPLPTREGETLGEIEGDGLFYVWCHVTVQGSSEAAETTANETLIGLAV